MPEFSSAVIVFIGLAIIVFIVEMFTMSFYAFFVSIGCALVALLLALGTPFFVALCSGSFLSILAIVVFHRLFRRKVLPGAADDTPFASLVGERGRVSESIPGQQVPGTVVLGGTAWRAVASCPIAAGSTVVVIRIDATDRTTVHVQEISAAAEEIAK